MKLTPLGPSTPGIILPGYFTSQSELCVRTPVRAWKGGECRLADRH